MASSSDILPRLITRSASGHTYTTIVLLVDRHRVPDAMRAYAYFRWVDDRLDEGDLDPAGSQEFLERQRRVIGAAYRGAATPALSPEEQMVVDLVRGDPRPESGLALYIRHMMDVMAFDVGRSGRLVTADELAAYTRSLATSVTEALHYFLDPRSLSPTSPARFLPASGAHIAHMLRDTFEDVTRGYFNIPVEVLRANRLEPQQIDSPAYRAWVRSRAARARRCLRLGRSYLSRVPSFRLRLASLAYSVRFERVLDSIERNDYLLRPGLHDNQGTAAEPRLFVEALLAAGRRGRPSRPTAGRSRGGRPARLAPREFG